LHPGILVNLSALRDLAEPSGTGQARLASVLRYASTSRRGPRYAKPTLVWQDREAGSRWRFGVRSLPTFVA